MEEVPGGLDLQRVTIHGHERAFVKTGRGPALLLLHGLGLDHTTWFPVLHDLARHFTVIAPDLLGHGASAKPRADYSVGGYANGMRDLLTVLDIDKVTVVGHSFGGGIAMQFAYQFPERTERMILVAPGGLGPEVSPLIRAITVPGFQHAMSLASLPGVRHLGRAGMRALARSGFTAARDLAEAAQIYDSFSDPAARAAIRHVVRSVVDVRGQIITMVDRAYLTQAMPMLVVWGADDVVIPARHAENVARIAPGAVVEVLTNSGHFPHRDHPDRFVNIVQGFVRATQPATYHPGHWQHLLSNGPLEPVNRAVAGGPPLAPVAQLPQRGA
jgi:pimeloyl-ACP methyl ester carboxylesterase